MPRPDHDEDRYIPEPAITTSVTITEGPQGITRSWSATVTGGTEWERKALLQAALADAELASEVPFIDARREHAERTASTYRQHIQIVSVPNGFGRNPDIEEGA